MYQTEQKEARYVAERVKVRAIIDAQEKKLEKSWMKNCNRKAKSTKVNIIKSI